jgi:hypothetical protein
MDRRAFLSILAGSPLIFGLRELLAQDAGKPTDAKAVPEWYQAALKRMKETRRYGIVIVLPDDGAERKRLGQALIDRYNEYRSGRHEPFGAVVFICLTRELASSLLKKPMADYAPNILVLDPQGKPVEWSSDDLSQVERPRHFELAFTRYAYGLRERRLSEQAKEIEKSIPEEVRKAAKDLTQSPTNPKAGELLLEKADAIFPWIVNKCREAESVQTSADGELPDLIPLRELLTHYWSRQSHLDSDPCLPFGLKVEIAPEADPGPPCGRMAVAPGKARKFLSFYEK